MRAKLKERWTGHRKALGVFSEDGLVRRCGLFRRAASHTAELLAKSECDPSSVKNLS
jgi:hypothetical protein